MTDEKIVGTEQRDREIEILMLVKNMLKKWWILLICALVFAAAAYVITQQTYTPTYSSKVSYAVNARDYTSGNVIQSATDFVIAEYLANTYSYILVSKDLMDVIREKIDRPNEPIERYIRTMLVENSNILQVLVTSDDPQMSYEIANSIIEYLPQFASVAVKSGSVTVLERPYKAQFPDANNRMNKNILAAFLIGLLASAVVVYLINYFHNTILSATSLQAQSGINLIGVVPHVKLLNKKKKHRGKANEANDKSEKQSILITDKNSGFVFIETYKSMRTKIERLSKRDGIKTILVTSALENEGKTTVAVNLALTLTQTGKSVIIVEGDLRKPSVHLTLHLADKVDKTVVDILNGEADYKKAILRPEGTRLDVLASRGFITNSAEVLSRESAKKLIADLKQDYDYVIVDTPPASLFTEASILAEFVDASILVVRQDCATINAVMGVSYDLSQTNADLIGFVFNNVEDATILPTSSYYGKKNKYSYYYYGRE